MKKIKLKTVRFCLKNPYISLQLLSMILGKNPPGKKLWDPKPSPNSKLTLTVTPTVTIVVPYKI